MKLRCRVCLHQAVENRCGVGLCTHLIPVFSGGEIDKPLRFGGVVVCWWRERGIRRCDIGAAEFMC